MKPVKVAIMDTFQQSVSECPNELVESGSNTGGLCSEVGGDKSKVYASALK